MTDSGEVTLSIERIIKVPSIWIIGITDDPEAAMQKHDNPTSWFQWRVASAEDARKVEKHFLDMGVAGTPGENGSSRYVFIYLN